ncbi:MAG: hypothetical protein ABIT37_03800 [Luteolibacter sp.]
MARFRDENSQDPERLDRALYRNVQRDVFGASAFHGLNPAQMCETLDEFDGEDHAASTRSALRCEIFAGFIEYLFADGPSPAAVQARIEGFFASFHPDLAAAIKGEREWVSAGVVEKILKLPAYAAHLRTEADAATSRGALSVWVADLETEFDQACVWETLHALIRFMVSEGKSWRIVTAVAYCLAKGLRPNVLAGMSLHHIAILSGDKGRATPSNRGKRLISRRLSDAGAKATHMPYQKSPDAVKKYAAAQLGNKNRATKQKSRKSKRKTDPRK